MKYKYYEEAYIRCKNCGGIIDQDSMLCKKCFYDMSKENEYNKTKLRRTKKWQS